MNRVLDGLLDKLSRVGRESMSTEAAEAIARTVVGGTGTDATRMLGLLQEEGVLARDSSIWATANTTKASGSCSRRSPISCS